MQQLNKNQKEAVAHYKGPCMVLAGPGSGKTLTIAKRIEYLIQVYKVRPEEILVITFTKYAANEMKLRFRKVMGTDYLPVSFGTFHSIYYGILKWAYGLNQNNILKEEEKYALLRQIVSGMGWEEEENAHTEDFLWELAGEIGNVKNSGYNNIEDYESSRYDAGRFREAFKAYGRSLEKAQKIDFEDMLLKCRKLFLDRPDILEKWQQKFRYILVDEFQDINQVQYDVVRMLASPEDNLFIVGDDDQSVYGFRGAKPGIMMDFLKDYPKARKVVLDVNYRSAAYIVDSALRMISHNEERFPKDIRAFSKAEKKIHVQEAKNPIEESIYIVEKIKEALENGIPLSQIAVLFRTAADAGALAETLIEYNVPFVMKERLNNIYEHFIGQDIMSYLCLSQGSCERRHFLRIANRPNRYIGRGSLSEEKITYEMIKNFYCDKNWMADRIDKLKADMEMIKEHTPYAAIEYIRKGVRYDRFLEEYAFSRCITPGELKEVLCEIQERSKEFKTIKEWISHVEGYKTRLKKQADSSLEKAGVLLLTMHGAKGLEFDTVFIIGGNEGSMPYKKAETKEELEEERRLFYVAVTRAKRQLIISSVKEKNGKDMNPSRFIRELFIVC